VAAARYEVLRTDDPIENHLLVDHETKASVALAPGRGGMVTRFRVGETNVLYLDPETLQDPAKNVRGGIPVLFPNAGRLRDDQLAIGDQRYTLRQHGFARTLPWTIVDQSTSGGARMVLELASTPATRAQFPFDFKISFTYTLAGGCLSIAQRYANCGDVEMPISPGLHPYFFVPDAQKAAARVLTDATSAYDNRAEVLTTLRGPIDLTAAEVDLHLLDHWPRAVRLVRPGDRDLDLALGMPDQVVVIWALRGRDFVCVEPWAARANALNDGGAVRVPPRGAHETTFSIAVA
jgi:galactose mutarotase-like enzyme